MLVDVDGLMAGIGKSATGCISMSIEREEQNRIIIIMCYSSQFKDNALMQVSTK